jgi:hypothetical protein
MAAKKHAVSDLFDLFDRSDLSDKQRKAPS